ncbi:MAG: ABC transporter ATP-binding protein [Acidimicrobiia bacterium]
MAGRVQNRDHPLMLSLESVSLRYPNGHTAIACVDLDVAAGEIVAVIGGSGCGKSTMLRLVAGLERPTSGSVSVGGEPVTGPTSQVGVMFQEPRLMPWLSVADNVTFGIGDLAGDERDRLAATILERVGLTSFAHVLPKQLSGGMAQRVALARALVGDPEVLLLDEPFSALDALTRADLQSHLLDVWSADRQTMLLVTHDIDEALRLADTVIVLAGRPGHVTERLTVAVPRPRDPSDPDLRMIRDGVLSALGSDKH